MSKRQRAAAPEDPAAVELLSKYEEFHKRQETTPRWIEVPLGQAPPKALIGRCCKVLWPLDEEWYKGVIFSHDSHTNKHLVVYYGYESEWLLLSKERILLHLPPGDKLFALKDPSSVAKPPEDSQELHGSAQAAVDAVAEGEGDQKAADVLASPTKRARHASANADESHFRPGCVVWAKIQGFPWWPAMVTHASRSEALGWTRAMGSTCCLLQYLGPKIEVGTTARKNLLPFAAGLARGYHLESKNKYKAQFRIGMEQLHRLLETGELPKGMQPWGDLEEEPEDESDDEGRVSAQQQGRDMSEDEDEDLDLAGDRRGGATQRIVAQLEEPVRALGGNLRGTRCGGGSEMVEVENRCLGASLASGGAQLATPLAQTPSNPVTLPKVVSNKLTIVDHGEIVTTSPHFHTGSLIYPLGYAAIRTFPSIKDPRIRVKYRMEILLQPGCTGEARSEAGRGTRGGKKGAAAGEGADRPLFRVTPEDCPELPCEGKDPGACWNEIRKRVQLARAQLVSTPKAQGNRGTTLEEGCKTEPEDAEGVPHPPTQSRGAAEGLPAVAGAKVEVAGPEEEKAAVVKDEMPPEQPAQEGDAPAAAAFLEPSLVTEEVAVNNRNASAKEEGTGALPGSEPRSGGASTVKLELDGHLPPECFLPMHSELSAFEPAPHTYSRRDPSLSPPGQRQSSVSAQEPKPPGGRDSHPSGKPRRSQATLTALWRGARRSLQPLEASPTGLPREEQEATVLALAAPVQPVQDSPRKQRREPGKGALGHKAQGKGGSTFAQPGGGLQPCRGRSSQKGGAGAQGQGKMEAVDAEPGALDTALDPPLEGHHFLSVPFGDLPELFSSELDFSLAPLLLVDSTNSPPLASAAKREGQPVSGMTAAWDAAGAGCPEEGLRRHAPSPVPPHPGAWGGWGGLGPDQGLAPDRETVTAGGQAGGSPTGGGEPGEDVPGVAGPRTLLEKGFAGTSAVGAQLEEVPPGQEERGVYSSEMVRAATTTENEVLHPDGTVFLPSARCRSGAQMFGLDLPVVQDILQALPNAHVGCPKFRAWRSGLAPTTPPPLLDGIGSGATAKKREPADVATPQRERAELGGDIEDEGNVSLRLLCSGSSLSSAERALKEGGSRGGMHHPGQAGLEGRVKRRKLTEVGALVVRSEGSNAEVEVAESLGKGAAACLTSAADPTGSKRKASLEPLAMAARGLEEPENGTLGGRSLRGSADKGRAKDCVASTPTPAECSSPTPAPKPGSGSHKKGRGEDAGAAGVAQAGAPVVYDRDATSERCDVCYMSEEYDNNQLLQCDSCRMMVHMDCYGVTEPPDGDLWLCQTCDKEALEEYRQSCVKAGRRRSLSDEGPAVCALCPVQGGAMKRSTEGGWVHVVCTLWIPETCFLDVRLMEPVDGIKRIPKARRQLRCGLCKVQHGVCVQCAYSKCCASFHPLCARYHGLHMRAVDESEQKQFKLHGTMLGSVVLVAFCKRHGGSVKGLSGDAAQASALPEPPRDGKTDRKANQRRGNSADSQPPLMLEAGPEACAEAGENPPGGVGASTEGNPTSIPIPGDGAKGVVVGEEAAVTRSCRAHRATEPPGLAAASTSSLAPLSVCSTGQTVAQGQGAGMAGAAAVSPDGSGSGSGSEGEEEDEAAAGEESERAGAEGDSDSEVPPVSQKLRSDRWLLEGAGLQLSSSAADSGPVQRGSRGRSEESEGRVQEGEQRAELPESAPEDSLAASGPTGVAPSEAHGVKTHNRKLFAEEPAKPPPIRHSCARADFYDWSCRRSRRGPEALAAALAKRTFLESIPYVVSGRRRRQLPLSSLTSLRGGAKGALSGSQEQWQGESGCDPEDGGAAGSASAPPGRAMNAHQAAELLTPHQMVSKWEAARLVFEASNLVWDPERGKRKERPQASDLQEEDDPLAVAGTELDTGAEPKAKRSLGHAATSSCSSTSSTPERKAGGQAHAAALPPEGALAPGAVRSRQQSLPGRSEGGEVLSMSERFRRVKSSLFLRLAFGKSAIHGWGVFARVPHAAGDMMIEYAGQVLRPIVADMRERRLYNDLVGAGTYMFRVDEGRVVDATRAGSIAHLINHSCEPNCYSRVVSASGEERVIIFARRNIQVGEELTYDYRFQSRDEEQLQCNCGVATCRGVVNKEDGEDRDDDDLSFGPQDSSTFRLPVLAPLSQIRPLRLTSPPRRGAEKGAGTDGRKETEGG